MLSETKAVYNDEILKEALKRFGATLEDCKKLGGFEAFVFEVTKNNRSYILKITHTHRRTVAYLMGELEFVNFLVDRGLKTSRAVPFLSGKFIEEIPDAEGGYFLANMFEKSEGRLSKVKDWTDDVIREWGYTAGKMCRIAREFQPSNEAYRRQQWYDDYIYRFEEHIPLEHEQTIRNCHRIIEKIKQYPITNDTYGLIHGDLHQGNFFLDNGLIHPFDFDDCEYSYFANEVAVPLYYAAPNDHEEPEYGKNRAEFAEHFFTLFAPAYLTENKLEICFLENLHDFLLLRCVIMINLFHATEFDEDDEVAAKKDYYLRLFHRRIDDNEPVIDLDFAALTRKL